MNHLPVKQRRGFTATEILITVAISAVAGLGVLSFMVSSLNVTAMANGKAAVSGDIRGFTMELTQEARSASELVLTSGPGNTGMVPIGGSGDMILLFYSAWNMVSDQEEITRVVGYYRDGSQEGWGPIRKFTQTGLSLTSSADYTPPGASAAHDVVVEFAEGLADGKLFFRINERGVVVRGEIRQPGRLNQDAINTYNFTVVPRG